MCKLEFLLPQFVICFNSSSHGIRCICSGKAGKEKPGTKGKASRLAPDPKPAPPPPEPTSAINAVILFDVPDAACLKRSAGRTGAASPHCLPAPPSALPYHLAHLTVCQTG